MATANGRRVLASRRAKGRAEHQTGLAIDLGENGPEVDFLCPAFPDSGPCGALRRRAADFGFVLRYPKGKENVTGIGYEPWLIKN